jgi:hypothetical protein
LLLHFPVRSAGRKAQRRKLFPRKSTPSETSIPASLTLSHVRSLGAILSP